MTDQEQFGKYSLLASVIISGRPGLVPADTSNFSHQLHINGEFNGLFESYAAAVEKAKFLTGMPN